jgi:hypothetical protein
MTRKERFEAQKEAAHEKALAHFMGQMAEIRERLGELTEYADDFMGYCPDEINWGHVGGAGYFLGKLTELTDQAFKRGEYAE